ncbi:uncharacterized protein LOC124896733 [Capsicum annuum]|uniref:uncharacterized protein LOC124896733 n=1 Tax=Capsicum annuum TaxID=4072 RepID=UPI001FB159A9|nr:uncharacterized protein LOC124896733 [Capsicum annuum]
MEPFQDGKYIEENRRRLGMKHVVLNVSEKIWVFMEENMEFSIVKDEEQQLTLMISNQNADTEDFSMLEEIPKVVTEEQNTKIMRIPDEEEVKKAVMGLNRDRAGGPNGMTGAFYQDAWEIIKQDIHKIAGFVQGRIIAKNTLVVQEIVSEIRKRDDMIILCKAEVKTLQLVTAVLDKYEEISGQKINNEKSAIYLHKGLSNGVKVLAEVLLVF